MKFKKLLESMEEYERYIKVSELVHDEYINFFKKYPKLSMELESPQTVKDTDGKDLQVFYDYISFKCYDMDFREHRVGGPSSVNTRDLKAVWKQKDKFHRENGPAFVTKRSGFHYFVNGREKSKEEYLRHFESDI